LQDVVGKEQQWVSMKAKKILQPGERIRVLVIDDSVVIRRLVTHALEQDPALEVVGVAANGAIALRRIPVVNPDVLTLDVEMPEMDGLETLRRVRKEFPHVRVIMFSTLTERGAAVTLEALTLGADDYVTKASNAGSLEESMASLRKELIPKLKQFFILSGSVASATVSQGAQTVRYLGPNQVPRQRTPPQVVGIGVSTGGPTALSVIVPQFPENFPLPVLVVQHMPAIFTQFLAARLQALARLKVREAVDGEEAQPGKILIAPGDYHMKVVNGEKGVRIRLDQSPHVNSCRPSVDALFYSLAEVYGGSVISVILTGMGQDGLRGVEKLKAQGAYVLAQDEGSSVVWGMPGAVVNAGLADGVLPLEKVVPEVLRLVGQHGQNKEVF